MTKKNLWMGVVLAVGLLAGTVGLTTGVAQTGEHAKGEVTGPLGILNREQAGAILPASVFYRGQSATVQARNSGGIRLDGGRLVLAAVVDTGGYSTAVQQTYQAYLISEVPLKFGEKTLPPGAYGFGFVEGDRMVVMDLGANEVLQAKTVRDAGMNRPNPLQILPEPGSPKRYRLYLGRKYVSLMPMTK